LAPALVATTEIRLAPTAISKHRHVGARPTSAGTMKPATETKIAPMNPALIESCHPVCQDFEQAVGSVRTHLAQSQFSFFRSIK